MPAVDADLVAITNLLHRYCELQDAADFPGVSDLFRHATYRVEGGPVVRGRDEVHALKTRHDQTHEDGTLRTKHVTTNTIVELDADAGTAATRSYFTVLQAIDGFPLQPVIAGRYLDTFARIQGEWWFTDRLIVPQLVGDLTRHLRDNPLDAR